MKCWKCKQAEMVEKKDKKGRTYLKCPKCGATETEFNEKKD